MICAILLAGGKSSRMGKNKAFLELDGRTFFDIMLDKLCSLNPHEIMVSGEPDVFLPALGKRDRKMPIQIIPDIVKEKGPLGGLYSCMNKTSCSTVLVVSTDVPLISVDTLNDILQDHIANDHDATVLVSGEGPEPLIAVYSTRICPVIGELIDKDSLRIRDLFDLIDTHFKRSYRNPSELYNCNTPEDYHLLLSR